MPIASIVRDRAAISSTVGGADRDEAIVVGEGKRAQDDAAHDTEDRRAHRDAEGERGERAESRGGRRA